MYTKVLLLSRFFNTNIISSSTTSVAQNAPELQNNNKIKYLLNPLIKLILLPPIDLVVCSHTLRFSKEFWSQMLPHSSKWKCSYFQNTHLSMDLI